MSWPAIYGRTQFYDNNTVFDFFALARTRDGRLPMAAMRRLSLFQSIYERISEVVQLHYLAPDSFYVISNCSLPSYVVIDLLSIILTDYLSNAYLK